MNRRSVGISAALLLMTGTLLAAKPAEENRIELNARKKWYKNQPGQEKTFLGVLHKVPAPQATSGRFNAYRLKMKDATREVFDHNTDAVLDKYVGKPVKLFGKAVELQIAGVEHHEIWPAYLTPVVPAAAEPQEAGKEEKQAAVREIKIEPKAVRQLLRLPRLHVMTNNTELEKQLGKVAARLAGKVDFEQEDLAFLRWQTSGPPFGELKYSIKQKDERLTVHFFVQEPNVAVRGRALKLGASFFAVPKGAQVVFGNK